MVWSGQSRSSTTNGGENICGGNRAVDATVEARKTRRWRAAGAKVGSRTPRADLRVLKVEADRCERPTQDLVQVPAGKFQNFGLCQIGFSNQSHSTLLWTRRTRRVERRTRSESIH